MGVGFCVSRSILSLTEFNIKEVYTSLSQLLSLILLHNLTLT